MKNLRKYPRTFHLPWSLAATSDDKTHSEADVEDMFGGREVVVTEKLDGENTTIYGGGYTHARSLDSRGHVSRDWVRALAGQVGHNIPDGWRVCGENCFAKHSIGYDKLASYFYCFGIYDGDTCLSWDETVDYATELELEMVPVLYRGIWDAELVKAAWTGRSAFGAVSEGYVVRLASAFRYENFSQSVAKFVRANHVQTDTHWMHQAIVANGLQDS